MILFHKDPHDGGGDRSTHKNPAEEHKEDASLGIFSSDAIDAAGGFIFLVIGAAFHIAGGWFHIIGFFFDFLVVFCGLILLTHHLDGKFKGGVKFFL
jgi:hypothetical protein